MIECSRKIDFDAGHRVIGHKNKCQYLHGHRYSLEITATALELDELGMVADFVVLKKIMKTWIDTNFDHNIILHKNDHKLGEHISKCTGQSVYYINSNPTAENIARIIYELLRQKIDNKYDLEITLYETPRNFVIYPAN